MTLRRSRRNQQATVREAQRPVELQQIDKALSSLNAKLQHCMDRLDIVDQRIDEIYENSLNTPSHADVMEVRMHSAKLAAELARATVELRGEIGMAGDEARRAARMSQARAEEPPVALPVDLTVADEDEHRGYSASA